MTHPKTVEALQFLVDLRQRLRVAPNTAKPANRALSFEGGTIATTLQGVGGLSTVVERAKFDWNVQLVPKGSAGRVNFGGGQLTGIVAGELPQGAWALVKHMHGPVGNHEMITAYQGMTPYRPAFAEFLEIAPAGEPPGGGGCAGHGATSAEGGGAGSELRRVHEAAERHVRWPEVRFRDVPGPGPDHQRGDGAQVSAGGCGACQRIFSSSCRTSIAQTGWGQPGAAARVRPTWTGWRRGGV